METLFPLALELIVSKLKRTDNSNIVGGSDDPNYQINQAKVKQLIETIRTKGNNNESN